MSVNFESTPIFADTASRRTDGSVIDQGSGASNSNRWLLGLESTGGNTPGFHALLRFATGTTLTDASMTLVRGRLRVTASARSTLGANYSWLGWASSLGASLAIGDHNKAYSNDHITSETLRVPIGTLFAIGGTVTDPTTGEIPVPNRFIAKGTGNVSDFEVRPYVASGALPAGANLTIYGADAGNAALRPRLVGEAYTDAELSAQNVYRFQAVGAESYVAVQVESTPGRAMKGAILLDARTINLDSQVENLESQSLTRQRARPRKVTIGRSGAGGDIVFEVTPEKWTSLLPGVMKYMGSIDVASQYGGGNTGVSEHHFRVGQVSDIKTFTVVTRRGAFRNVYPGGMISSLEFSSDLDQIVSATAAFMAREEFTYDQDAAGVNDANLLLGTAGYDTVANSVLSFVGGQVSFADPGLSYIVDRGIIQNFTISLRNDVQEKRGHSRQRGVTGHFPLGFRAELRFSLYLENEVQLRRYLGIDDKNFPYMPEKQIMFQKVKIALAGSGGSSGMFLTDRVTPRQEIIFEFPAMMYTAVTKPIQGEGAIMLECTGVGTYDGTTDNIGGAVGTVERGNLMVTVRNAETSVVFDPPTETIPNLITVLPEGVNI
jgi:hypothetical protein